MSTTTAPCHELLEPWDWAEAAQAQEAQAAASDTCPRLDASKEGRSQYRRRNHRCGTAVWCSHSAPLAASAMNGTRCCAMARIRLRFVQGFVAHDNAY